MCGFVCLVSPRLAINPELLNTMRDRLLHRGPDSGHSYITPCKTIGFGHRRLSVVDTESSSDQPMTSICSKYLIIFNGEIYNHNEIRQQLRELGHKFYTNSDTEVLLLAYKEWKHDCLQYLNGMFAFVIFDTVSRKLFVARDRFGEKPLFIGRGKENVLIFASEMKAILAHPLVSDVVNISALNAFASDKWYEDSEESFFLSIKRFPQRHYAYYSLSGDLLSRSSYWDPDTELKEGLSTRDVVSKFSELFTDSVRLRNTAAVPVGSSVSGGLDSSAIVAYMNQNPTNTFDLSTYSAIFNDDPTISEHKQIKLVTDSLNTQSHYVSPSADGLQRESLLLHWHQEEPFSSASIYLQWCVARLAKATNTTVLLDGQGADELLGGYQFLFKRYQLDSLRSNGLAYTRKYSKKFTDRLQLESANYSNSQRRFSTSICYSDEELCQMADNPPSIESKYNLPHALASQSHNFKRSRYEGLFYNSLPMLLRYADRNSMAFSREVRLPFLDHRLVEFMFSVPEDIHVRNGWQKYVLRQSMPSTIPSSIKWRRDKVGYAAPLDIWLRGPLKRWAYERVTDHKHLSIIDSFDLQANYQAFMDHQFLPNTNLSWLLWKWISLSEWLSLHRSGVWKSGIANSLLYYE